MLSLPGNISPFEREMISTNISPLSRLKPCKAFKDWNLQNGTSFD
jgi:hypothetical protein